MVFFFFFQVYILTCSNFPSVKKSAHPTDYLHCAIDCRLKWRFLLFAVEDGILFSKRMSEYFDKKQ